MNLSPMEELDSIGEGFFKERGFVFVRMPNTASTSMRIAFTKLWPEFPRNHITLDQYLDFLGIDAFQKLDNYAFLRDPTHCAITRFCRTRYNVMRGSLETDLPTNNVIDFAKASVQKEGIVVRYEEMLLDKRGRPLVKETLPFESLGQSWKLLCSKIGIDMPLSHHNDKASIINNTHDEHYSEELETIVRAHHKKAYEMWEECTSNFANLYFNCI